MATWPASLPQTLTLRHGYEFFAPHDRVRDEMDQGPAFQRPRASSRVIVLPDCHLYLTKAQFDTFEAFLIDTLGNGSEAFEWEDPIPGMGTVQVQFGEGVPSAQWLTPGDSPGFIDVTFTLEVLP